MIQIMENKEEWKSILGYEDTYEVSSLGRFRSLSKNMNGRWGITRYRGKVIKSCPHPTHGYGIVSLVQGGVKSSIRSHRAVAMAFIENPDDKPFVNHIDADRMNNSVDNLEWVTAQENSDHAKKLNLFNPLRGEDVVNSKLTEYDVADIRNLYGIQRQVDLAETYGVSKSTISDIIHWRTWKHI